MARPDCCGCHSLFDIERLSVMWAFEPLKRLPDLIKLHDIYQHHAPAQMFLSVLRRTLTWLELKLRRGYSRGALCEPECSGAAIALTKFTKLLI